MLVAGSEFGGYRIEGVLGQGGMGTVYEAVQLSLDRTVALKVLSPELSANVDFRERFRREGRQQAAIDHDHIVTVYEAGEAEERLYIAMRLIRGATLKQLIEMGDLDDVRLLGLMSQVADALDTAHGAGLVHRDVKPHNVLVGPADHAYLADFGLTKTGDQTSLTQSGTFMGTLDYSSPEQLRGEPTTPASDIYALAAVTYECLTGTVPYARPTQAAVISAHLFDAPPRVTDTNPGMPATIDRVLAGGLAKNPVDRPSTATALIEELNAALGYGTLVATALPGGRDGSRAPTPLPGSSATRLIGRIEELAELRAALNRAREAEPQAVLLAGDAGMGKSRLVEEFTSRALRGGVRVLSGGCIDLGETAVPYAAMADALRATPHDVMARLPDSLRGHLAALVPEAAPPASGEPSQSTSAPDPAGLFGAVVRLLEELGSDGPLVVVLEDIHWADRSTHDLLRFLLRGLRDTAVLLVLTYRTDELHRRHPLRPLLAELQRSPRVSQVTLPPLSRDETVAQIAAVLGEAREPAFVDRLYARSEGNPFFTEELLAADTLGLDISTGLREALVMRIERLSDSASTVAGIAAAVGREIDHRLLATLSDLPDDARDSALRECLAERILVVDAGGVAYRFRHALLQEAMYGELLPGERQRLHRRIAQTLSAEDASGGPARARLLAEVAHHWHRAHDNEQALTASLAAARAAEEVFGLTEASRLYDRALELWDTVKDPKSATGADLAFVCERAGECRWLGLSDAGGAAALLERALALLPDDAPTLRRANLLSRLGMCSWELHGSPQEGLHRHKEALALLDDEPSATAARVLARYANALLLIPEYPEAEARAREAIKVARLAAARREEADALVTLLVCEAVAGEVDATLALVHEAREMMLAEPDAHVAKRLFTNASHCLNLFGRYEESVATAREGIALMEGAGLNRFGQLCIQENAVAALCALGRLDEVNGVIGEDPGALNSDTIALHVELANFKRVSGDLDAACTHLDLLAAAGVKSLCVTLSARAWRADIELWRGNVDRALAVIQEGEAAIVEDDRGPAAQVLTVAVRVQAERAERDPALLPAAREEADRLLARLGAIVAGGTAPLPEPEAQLALAEAERSRLDGDFDPEPWRRAAEKWEALRRPYDVAYARLGEARTLAATGAGRDELQAALDAAHAAAAGMGARRLLAEIEDLARASAVVLPGAAQATLEVT